MRGSDINSSKREEEIGWMRKSEKREDSVSFSDTGKNN